MNDSMPAPLPPDARRVPMTRRVTVILCLTILLYWFVATYLLDHAQAAGLACPDVALECTDVPLWPGLDAAGVTPAERQAIAVIVESTLGERTGVDWYEGPRRISWPHLTGADPLRIGTDDEATNLAVLYSPEGAALVLATWRDRTSNARMAAHAEGYDLTTALVLANSLGSRGFTDLAHQCGWSRACTLDAYGTRRARRAGRLRAMTDGGEVMP